MKASLARAEREASDIIRRFGLTSLPVDPEKIAGLLSIQVMRMALEPETSGLIVRKNGRAIIAVNDGHHERRQRFSIAHEIGHFVLHNTPQEVFVDYRDARASTGEHARERESNAFAAALLMPETMLRRDVSSRGIDLSDDDETIQGLAGKYDVSVQAMTYRLINLGLVHYR